jgi:hypothetical protein
MPYGETHAIWTQGGDAGSRVTSQDTVVGTDGKQYTSDQATIWRWREAFQNDFAARMQWTVADYRHANHNPVVEVVLDASLSHDPDEGQHLRYAWFHYAEAGGTGTNMAAVTITGANSSTAVVTPTAVCRAQWLPTSRPCRGTGTAHIILLVTDDGSPRLTSYRRIILNVHATAKP